MYEDMSKVANWCFLFSFVCMILVPYTVGSTGLLYTVSILAVLGQLAGLVIVLGKQTGVIKKDI